MKAELKSIYDPSTQDLANYLPDDPNNFCVLFRAMVGIKDIEGEESFDIQVCTPGWFLSTMKQHDIIPGRHFLIVLEYNYDRIYNKIKHLIENCTGNDWDEVADKVSRIGFWEFEDYQD